MPTIQKTLRILEFIRRVIALTGESPTLREIATEFHFRALSSVHEHITKMEKRGWITKTPHVSRGIRVVERRKAA